MTDIVVAGYLRQVAASPELTSEQEAALFRQLGDSKNWDEDQEEIARRLLESKLRLVVAIAEKRSSSPLSIRERLEEGNRGLLYAVQKYSAHPQGEFTSFAAACIEEAILAAEKG